MALRGFVLSVMVTVLPVGLVMTVHNPLPIVGVLPANTVVNTPQIAWSDPALAASEKPMVTSSVVLQPVPVGLVTVHRRMYVPYLSTLIVLDALEGVPNVTVLPAGLLKTLHDPLPIVGVLPVITELSTPQIAWSDPALAVSTKPMVTSSVVLQPVPVGLVTVHRRMYVPYLSTLIVLDALEGVPNVTVLPAGLLKTLHDPLPIVGVLPAITELSTPQIAWSDPALAVSTKPMVTSSVVLQPVPVGLVTVHRRMYVPYLSTLIVLDALEGVPNVTVLPAGLLKTLHDPLPIVGVLPVITELSTPQIAWSDPAFAVSTKPIVTSSVVLQPVPVGLVTVHRRMYVPYLSTLIVLDALEGVPNVTVLPAGLLKTLHDPLPIVGVLPVITELSTPQIAWSDPAFAVSTKPIVTSSVVLQPVPVGLVTVHRRMYVPYLSTLIVLDALEGVPNVTVLPAGLLKTLHDPLPIVGVLPVITELSTPQIAWSDPAFAVSTKPIVTSSVVLQPVPVGLVTVHRRMYVPYLSTLIVLDALEGVPNVTVLPAGLLKTLHDPLPIVGVLPVITELSTPQIA